MNSNSGQRKVKVYWFIPDGLRADPEIFNIFRWAQEGKLPHIAEMMRRGSYGFSIPVYPGHTPVNFATLFTGLHPGDHGVVDGPLRLTGYPLNIVSRSGFSSTAKIVDPIWYTAEQQGILSTLLSVPGSTPPEINLGYVIKGRWGGWGMELPALNFHTYQDAEFRKKLGWNDRLFGIDKPLTHFTKPGVPSGWKATLPESYSPLQEVSLENWDTPLFALIADSTDDDTENYDQVWISRDKARFLFFVRDGDWSDWFDLPVSYRLNQSYQENYPQKSELEQELTVLEIQTQARIKVIKLGKKGFFRLRLLYGGLNESLTKPYYLATQLNSSVGPMVDFVDNYPPQLIYYGEDRKTFLEEAEMSFDWHRKAIDEIFKSFPQDLVIHNIYTPNQMLTSRWWMGYLDPKSVVYDSISEEKRSQIWDEVLNMYKEIDRILGQAIKELDEDSYIILSSDHGVAPLNYEVKLNNLFAKKGWLKFNFNKDSLSYEIDWQATKVVYLNMNHIYINPKGLAGAYYPSSGPAYEKLRAEVSQALLELRDGEDQSPLEKILKREEARELGLDPKLVGDLIIANKPGYNWIEDVSDDHEVFIRSLKSGYKQAIIPSEEKALWTPFVIMGPGIKAGHEIKNPISHLQQYPTVVRLLGITTPLKNPMGALDEIFEE